MVQKGVYRHYKGGVYRVLGVGKIEATLEDVVIYQSLANASLWVRPVAVFTEPVDVNGKPVPRFSFVSEIL